MMITYKDHVGVLTGLDSDQLFINPVSGKFIVRMYGNKSRDASAPEIKAAMEQVPGLEVLHRDLTAPPADPAQAPPPMTVVPQPVPQKRGPGRPKKV